MSENNGAVATDSEILRSEHLDDGDGSGRGGKRSYEYGWDLDALDWTRKIVKSDGTTPVVTGLSIPEHDYILLGYTGSNVTSVTYKIGGSSGTTVATLTLVYDGSSNLTSVTKA